MIRAKYGAFEHKSDKYALNIKCQWGRKVETICDVLSLVESFNGNPRLKSETFNAGMRC